MAERETLSGHLAPTEVSPERVDQMVRQAVSQVADQQDADAALRVALLNVGKNDIPLAPGDLAMFVLGPLRNAVAEFVNDKAANRLVRTLKPLLRMKSELELPASEDERSDSELPPPSGELDTVLVIDDEISSRGKAARLLREARYAAVSAGEPSVGLAMCVRRRPDVIVASPSAAAGGQLSALLQVAFGAKTPPLVVMKKPLEPDTLLSAIEAALEK